MRQENFLFSGGALRDMLDMQLQTAAKNVDVLSPDQLRDTSIEALVEYIANPLCFDPLSIYKDGMTRDQQECQVDVQGWPGRGAFGRGPCMVSGIKLVISLPFSGESRLWNLQPSSFMVGINPHGTVVGSNLEMVFEQPIDVPPETFKNEIEINLKYIDKYLSMQKNDIENFNNALPNNILRLIEARRQILSKHEILAKTINIPLKHDPNAPKFEPIRIQKRILKPLPPIPTGATKREFGIAELDYQDIINLIHHVGRTFEETPRTYAVHDEEELRDIILANLNIFYKASGETFRRSGKTDIIISAEDRAAFVAECKIWSGPKTVTDAIDQLLGYLTWRDCKTAIIIFNKAAAGFTSLLPKTQEALNSHARFVRIEKVADQGEWICVFKSKDDDSLLVRVCVFLFNLYVAPQNPEGLPNKTKTV
jgi:hypothetical protein